MFLALQLKEIKGLSQTHKYNGRQGEKINKETIKMVKEGHLMTKTETLVREIDILITFIITER
jgi:hypothetical protein